MHGQAKPFLDVLSLELLEDDDNCHWILDVVLMDFWFSKSEFVYKLLPVPNHTLPSRINSKP